MSSVIRNTQIFKEENDVDAALANLGLTRSFAVMVGRAASAAKADTLPIDALSAPGTQAYLAGIRAIRLGLLPQKGWRINRLNNIESTVNDDLGIQICFQNVDIACVESREPQALSNRGPASREIIAAGQGELFENPHPKSGSFRGKMPTVWVICVAADDSSLQVEVSCPRSFTGKQFQGFCERIFVLDDSYEPDAPDTSRKSNEFDELELEISKKA